MTQALWLREAHLVPDQRSPSFARRFVSEHLRQHDLLYLVHDAELVVSELVSSALEHPGTTIDITLEEQPFCVVLTVHDRYQLDPLAAACRGNLGGQRVMIVGRTALEWGVEADPEGGESIWVLFGLRPPSFHEWTGTRG